MPTPSPTVVPTATVNPSAKPTVTAHPAPVVSIAPQPSANRNAFYGNVFYSYPTNHPRAGIWAGQPINSAIGEVYVMTKASDTEYKGYIQVGGSFRVDGVPTGNDVKIVKIVVYRDSGEVTIEDTIDTSNMLDWLPFNDVWTHTPFDIDIG